MQIASREVVFSKEDITEAINNYLIFKKVISKGQTLVEIIPTDISIKVVLESEKKI